MAAQLTAASYPTCEYLPDFKDYPTDGISQLVFKNDAESGTTMANDRPDRPDLASYLLELKEASGAQASFILSVKNKQPDGFTLFRTIFYTSQGYPDIYVHKVKNNVACSATVLHPANTEGNLAMNVIAFAA